MRPHQKLDVWTKSIELAVSIYRQTEAFPKEEKFGLTQQLRRAAVSVASNVAEVPPARLLRSLGSFYLIPKVLRVKSAHS